MNRKIYKSLFLLLLGWFFSIPVCFGQFAQDNIYWKRNRQAISFGAGACNFLGELGGRDQIGSGFIWDLEPSQSRPSLQLDYHYNITRVIAARASLTYGMLAGNDNLTKEPFRRNRNIVFRSPFVEFSGMVEIDILNLYKKVSGSAVVSLARRNNSGSSIYAFLGFGGLYFNPQGNYQGRWVNLRPLGTEGQKQPNGPKEYSKITACIPVGLGYRVKVNTQWSVGIEFSYRKTFSDYLDDTSTIYYDNNTILQTQGELAAHFADPSLGYQVNAQGQTVPLNSTFTGAQRGDPSKKDAYLLALIKVRYTLQHRYGPKRSRIFHNRTRRILF